MEKRKDELKTLSLEIAKILKESSTPYSRIEITADSIKMTSIDWSEPTEAQCD